MNSKQQSQKEATSNRSAEPGSAFTRKRWPPIIILVIVSVVVYTNSLSNGFVYDDLVVIVENKYIRNPLKNLPSLFTGSYYKIAGGEAGYRPIATLSYYLIFAFAGLNPFYFHLVSVLIHIANACLVYLLCFRVLPNKSHALLAGLLFACHPALTEAVDCISFNEDLLAALFYLLSLILYVKTTHNQVAIAAYILSLICYFLGLLSKEMAITLPGIVFLYDIAFRGEGENSLTIGRILRTIRKKGFFYSGYIIISLVYLVLRFSVFYEAKGSTESHYGSLFDRIVFLPSHIFSFIKLAFAPFNLSAAHVFFYPQGFFELTNLVGFTAVSALIVFSFYFYKRSKVMSFGIWWFLITLFPVYNLIEIFHPYAERFVYIPIIGFCMLIPVVIDALVVRIVRKPTAATLATPIVVMLILSVYAITTISRNRDWKDGMTLWSKTILTSPGSAIAHGNLGRAFQEQKKFNEAIQAYEKTIEINPRDYKAYHNLGVVYENQGAMEEAVHYYEKAIEIYPQYADAHFNLANIYHKKGALDDAIAHYKKVVELQPEDFEARNNLGVAYAMQGKLDHAISQWKKVLEIDPENKSAEENITKAKMVKHKSK